MNYPAFYTTRDIKKDRYQYLFEDSIKRSIKQSISRLSSECTFNPTIINLKSYQFKDTGRTIHKRSSSYTNCKMRSFTPDEKLIKKDLKSKDTKTINLNKRKLIPMKSEAEIIKMIESKHPNTNKKLLFNDIQKDSIYFV